MKYFIAILMVITGGCCSVHRADQNTRYTKSFDWAEFSRINAGESLRRVIDKLGYPFELGAELPNGQSADIRGEANCRRFLKEHSDSSLIILQYSAPIDHSVECFKDAEIHLSMGEVTERRVEVYSGY